LPEPGESEAEGAWAKLGRRKVAQWGIAYAAGAWGLLQGLEYVTDTFGWPGDIQQLATLALLVGLPFVLVIAWYHGDRGQQRVTAAELTILTLLFLLGGGIFWRYDRAGEAVVPAAGPPAPAVVVAPPVTDTIAEKSIAVLPFVNMSDSADTEYFSDGLAEEILNALAQISGLRVPSRTSSFSFRGKDVDLKSVATTLAVAHVLEGSVRRDRQRIRVTAQLIDARSDSHLWSKTWDRDLTDVFEVQQEIAVEIANSLQVQFAGPDGGPRSVGTTNVAAYESYLEGRHLWRQRGEGPLRQSIARFEEAIRLDAGFARAHAGLAAATAVLISYTGADVPAEPLLNAAQTYAQRALSLDPSLAEAHAVLASVLEERWQWQAADAEFRRAVALDPSDSTSQQWYSEFLGRLGRFREAEVFIQQALTLDPLSPVINLSASIAVQAARGDTAAALELARRASTLGMKDRAAYFLALIHITAGDARSARAMVPNGTVAASVLDALIDPEVKPAALARLQSAPPGSRRTDSSLSSQLVPLIYLGEIDRAHDAARRSLEDLSLFPADFLAPDASPNFARFRADPRFQQLVREAGLLDYWRAAGWPDLCRPKGEGVECDFEH
jgi:TolB-like protein/tetratricopeptide (TPR) repeat protein